MAKGIMNISLPRDVQFGPGCIGNLARKAKELGMTKPLVVCDPSIIRLGFAQKVRDLLAGAEMESALFDHCVENPRDTEIVEGTAVFVKEGCDGLVAVGGGSVIDSAKAVRVLAKQGGKALDYDVKVGGIKKIGMGLHPMIAVPTTSGTGSEATLAAVIVDTARKVKFVIFSPYLMPSAALLDPELTLTMPPALTAATGFDALIHAVEAYTVKGYHPLADGLCRTVFELVGKSLQKAVADGDDLSARGDMAMASLLGGVVLTLNGLGAVHALSHQLSSAFGVPHGTANAMMLPHVMRFNSPEAGARYMEAVGLMGFAASSAEEAADRMARLTQEVGLPMRLRDVGVTEEALPRMVEDALMDIALPPNPVPCTKDDLMELYKRAM